MNDFKPTKSQQQAIDTRGRSVLVSAAAGSGKTRVLTQRLIKAVEDGADIDSFLVITFTKAAAAELKGRIVGEIAERIAQEPDNRRLRRQSALCAKAQIGTIDSFCQTFLRENCHAAQLAPEFKVIEEDRAEAIKARVIERVLDACYENPTDDFRILADTVGAGRDDSRLAKTVLDIHRKTQSHARPEKWLREQLEEMQREVSDVAQTPWGREILDGVESSAEYWGQRMDELCILAGQHPQIAEKYLASLEDTALSLRDLARACKSGWDSARQFLPVSFPALGRLVNSPSPETSEYIKQVRKLCKAAADKFPKTLSDSSEKLLEQLRAGIPAMRELVELTVRFDRQYSAEKRRRAEVDFADLEHLTAQLLTNEDSSPTALAREISTRFTEIMVDEYQDVNRVQDDIFRALSNDGKNLFMVGDIKQSIYRFRLADPNIFTQKYSEFSFLEDADEGEPVKIMLQENFRSRREVIDECNAVFGCCMSEKLGEIEYDEHAQLKCGASYPGSVPEPELILISAQGEEDDLRSKAEKEALVVADKISQLMSSGMTVGDRPLRWSDIVILMRSANSAGDTYRRALLERGIPVSAGQSGSFFGDSEVSELISLLAVIDNPHKDVPLIAVLRSPAFGFTPDELTEIRVADTQCDFYTALTKAAETNEKCSAFLQKLSVLRARAPEETVSEFIRYIYNELDLEALCAAMRDPARRLSNLQTVLELAKRFEAGGFRGLHRFCQWLDRLAERGGDIGSAAGEDAVQIMTIHKSKGLEFPVVFLCDTSRKFNDGDLRQTVLVHSELGLGAKIYDPVRRLEYPGVQRNAISSRLRREQLSEEMRLLYVALTRAKERLFMTAAVKAPEDKLQKMMLKCTDPMSPEVLLTAQSMADWLIYAKLCRDSESLSIVYPESVTAAEESAVIQEVEVRPELVREIERCTGYVYPHESASGLPSKATATELKRLAVQDEEAASIAPLPELNFRMPEPDKAERLTPAQRGTALHTLLQYIDYGKTGTAQDVRSELARLTSRGFLSAAQAESIDVGRVTALFSSDIGRRMLAAKVCRREFKFSLLCPAERFFDSGEGEKVLLQGVMDCVIEEPDGITVIDYKTDRVRGEALKVRAEEYRRQLEVYAYAAERIMGKPVRECVLYFLHAGEEYSIKSACK